MGQKKQRNHSRNEAKTKARRATVDQQNAKHDAFLFSEAMRQTGVMRQRPSDEEYPYTTLYVAETMPTYQKIDPKFIYIQIESKDVPFIPDETQSASPENLEVQTQWTAVMYANKSEIQTVIAQSHNVYGSYTEALDEACREFPIVAVRQKDGTFEYPHYDERKGKLMAEAETRRLKRQQKALEHLNLTISLAASTGGL